MTVEKKLHDKLLVLYQTADSLAEEIPRELAKKIEVYCEILMIVGRLHAAAVYDYGAAYANRKRVYGIKLVETDGTQRDKEGAAEDTAFEFRMTEAHYEAEMTRWKNAFVATQELINAMKKSLELLRVEMGLAGNGTGN